MIYAPGPMTAEDWASNKVLRLGDPTVKHQWGDRQKIDRCIIKCVDDFASTYKHSVLVTCGTQGKHVDNSWHYQGLALDIMFPQLHRRQLPDVMLQLLRYPFGGIGMYTEWKLRPDYESIGGFHVDMRPSSVTATWIKEHEGNYVGLTVANMRKYFV